MTISTPKTDALALPEAIKRIVALNEGLRGFWSGAQNWAPIEAADLLTKSRLDRQVSLSNLLYRWVEPPSEAEKDAVQIIAYANLGSLVEGTLKLFLSVFYETYKIDSDAIVKFGKLQNPDVATLDPLRQYFKKKIWNTEDPADAWDAWILKILQRRNSIHAFKHRDIGTFEELQDDIRAYLKLLRRINNQLPYPDDRYTPIETETPYGELESEVASSAG